MLLITPAAVSARFDRNMRLAAATIRSFLLLRRRNSIAI
jgi:hypothetical protein